MSLRALGVTLLAVVSAEAGIAQTPGADLNNKIATYQEHLQRAMELYGHGFSDPGYPQKVPGFDQDIRTGNPTQTERIRREMFASILMTSGVHLDPDPLHDWAEIERILTSFPGAVSQKERELAESLRPVKLSPGQTLAAHSAEGLNLRFTLLGIQFGRELGNVNALIQLTYCGGTLTGHSFLLTSLAADEEKTRTDTWVRSRTLLIYSASEDPVRYGHVITAQDHGDYRVLSARIADVAPKIHDWIWKSVGPQNRPAIGLPELETAVRLVQESERSVDSAVDAFQQLALKAVKENDAALASEAAVNHRKAQIPEQDLKLSSPDVRAKLYAVRALSAGDPRFVAALEAVSEARRRVETLIEDGRDRFGFFNGLATYRSPELPWKGIERAGAEFMNVAEGARRASAHAAEVLPRTLGEQESNVTFQSSVLVEQTNNGSCLVRERIVRDVHWAVKGIPRREYVSELIEVSPETGLHRVQNLAKPAYVQGPGGIGQVFQDLSKTQAFAF
jgi:hypothetical protein